MSQFSRVYFLFFFSVVAFFSGGKRWHQKFWTTTSFEFGNWKQIELLTGHRVLVYRKIS